MGCGILFCLCLATAARAAEVLWDQGGGSSSFTWSTAANWSGDSLPTADDDVVIGAPFAATNGVWADLEGVTRSVRSLSFNSNSSRINGINGGTLNLIGANAAGHNFSATRAVNISSHIVLGDAAVSGGTTNLVWHSTAFNPGTNFTRNISKANAGQIVNLEMTGGGQLSFGGSGTAVNHDNTTISGGWIDYFRSTAGTHSFGSGSITVRSGGTFVFNGTQSSLTLSNPIIVDPTGGTVTGSYSSSATFTRRFTGPITLGGDLRVSAGANFGHTMEFSGDVTVTGSGPALKLHTALASTAGSVVKFTGNIVEDAPGRQLTFDLMTDRAVTLSGTGNNWSGGTVIRGTTRGFVDVAAGSSLGSGNIDIQAGGNLRIASQASLLPGQQISLARAAFLEISDEPATATVARIAPSSSGVLALAGDPAGLDLDASGHSQLYIGAIGTRTISTSWTPHGGVYRLAGGLGFISTAPALTIGGDNVLTGNAALVYGYAAETAGLTRITKPQNYTGGTTLLGGILEANATGALGSGPVAIEGGELVAGAPNVIDASLVTLNKGTLTIKDTAALSGGAVTIRQGGTVSFDVSATTGVAQFQAGVTVDTPAATIGVKSGASNAVAAMNDLTIGSAKVMITSRGSLGSSVALAVNGTTTFSAGASIDVNNMRAANAANRMVHVALNGPVHGDGPLVKTGSDVLGLFNSANNFTGIDVQQGTLAFDGDAALGNPAGGIRLRSFATALRYQGSADHTLSRALVMEGGTIEASGSGLFTIPRTASFSFTGNTALVLAGTGQGRFDYALPAIASLEKRGTGTWTLSADTANAPRVSVAGGTLKLGAPQALGAVAQSVIVNSGILDLNGYDLTANDIGGAGGVIMNSAANPATLTVALKNSDDSITTPLFAYSQSVIDLVKTGRPALTVTGDQAYTGRTIVREGVLSLSGNSAGALVATSALRVEGGEFHAGETTSSVGPPKINQNIPLTLGGRGGGLIRFKAPATALFTQQFASLDLQPGNNIIQATSAAHLKVRINGALTRQAGATLAVGDRDFALPASDFALQFANSPVTSGIIGSAYTWYTNATRRYLTVDAAGNAVPFTGIVSNDANDISPTGWIAGNNIELTAPPPAPMNAPRTIHSLRIAAPTETLLDLGGNTLTLGSGGILVYGGNGLRDIHSGQITIPEATPDLIITNDRSITISARLSLGAKPLVKTGSGTLYLSHPQNTFSALHLNAGYLDAIEPLPHDIPVTVADQSILDLWSPDTLSSLTIYGSGRASIGMSILEPFSAVKIGTVQLAERARIDVDNGGLVLSETPESEVAQWLARPSPGIYSQRATSINRLAVGWGTASDILGIAPDATATWLDKSVSGDDLLFRTVYRGDTNLDLAVTFTDLLTVAANFGQSGADWVDGDFDGDGLIGFTDLLQVAANFGAPLPLPGEIPGASPEFSQAWLAAQAAVPEPAGVFAVLAAMALLRRVRR